MVDEARFRALVSGQTRGPWPALQRCGLWLASWPYGLGVRLRNGMYERGWKERHKAPVPVVSVGNLTVGGTGKTPCVEYVARHYREGGLRVAVLSRGYGSEGGRNDEAMVLEENLPDVPHLQGPDRVALAATAVEELESEVLVLDDGFQHRRLLRDLDVVLIDATNPWGHGHLLPRGLLREPPSSLRRAGIVVLTRCDQVGSAERGRLREAVARLAPAAPVAETTHRPVDLSNGAQVAPLSRLCGRPAAGFCGVGNPEAFRRTLGDLGIDIVAFRTFPDHHAYARADVDDLRAWADRQAKDCVVVTTQKDLVKLRLTDLGGRELWALHIQLHVEAGKEEFDRRLEAAIRPAV
ncbi:MAG TPA: tetraacyldisaccharide 4'-kinase [Gemmataceae bacterium]|nr:tetraacyldisaccharide 4'-kinase [Gemmataceae bacterium]